MANRLYHIEVIRRKSYIRYVLTIPLRSLRNDYNRSLIKRNASNNIYHHIEDVKI